MKTKLIKLYVKIRAFIAAHKLPSIIAASVAGAVLLSAAAVIIINRPATEVYAKENKAEETTAQEEAVAQVTTETEAATPESSESTTPGQLIPIKNIKVAKTDISSKAEVMGGNQAVEEAPVNTGAIYEVSDLVYGIDVSKHQNTIDWARVKASGVKFAIIKIAGRGYETGELYQDACFTRNIQNALANGIQVGVYFFSQALNEQEALEEASLTVAYLQGYNITYPVCFDWETSEGYRTYNANISKAQMNSIASTFCDAVKSAGYTPMVYASKNDWLNRYDTSALSSKYKSWLANYFYRYQDTGNWYQLGENLPDYKYKYQMWQYSSHGRVDGISGNVDLNLGFFSYSGSNVPKSSIVLNVANSSLSTNVGSPINLLNGVSAVNTVGADVSSSVSVTINSSGNVVDENTAFNNPGTYVITYKVVDFTGGAKSASASLTVRGKPAISGIQPAYTVSEGMSYENILAVLKDGITAADYEGVSLSSQITITGLPENGLTAGSSYPIAYTVTDKTGLTSTYNSIVMITPTSTQAPQP